MTTLNLTPATEKILWEAFYRDPATRRQLKKEVREDLAAYTQIKRSKDPNGRGYWSIVLNHKGEDVMRFLQIQNGFEGGPRRGVAIEHGRFVAADPTYKPASRLADSLSDLCKRYEIPCRREDDWRQGSERIIPSNTEDLIQSIDRDVEWHNHQDLDLLQYMHDFTGGQTEVWSFLDENRFALESFYQPHIITWDHT